MIIQSVNRSGFIVKIREVGATHESVQNMQPKIANHNVIWGNAHIQPVCCQSGRR